MSRDSDASGIACLEPVRVGGGVARSVRTPASRPQAPLACERRRPDRLRLTNMEYRIQQCLKRGDTDKEIATELGTSDRTVSNHVNHILVKLSARNRTHAVVKALGLGVIRLE